MTKLTTVTALEKSIKRYEKLLKKMRAATVEFEETGCAVCDYSESIRTGAKDSTCSGCPLDGKTVLVSDLYDDTNEVLLCDGAYGLMWHCLDESIVVIEDILVVLRETLKEVKHDASQGNT